jgi:hypothetical protein
MDHPERREEEYRNAISRTLSILPPSIRPIIVENNGSRSTWLTTITFQHQPIRVIYTDHNQQQTKNKGITELMDLHHVIEQCNILPQDMIIKLTGRYYPLTSYFFETVIHEENQYDAFIRFYNVTCKRSEEYDCVLGMYAIRCSYLMCWNPRTVSHYLSPEVAFARYIRFSGARLKEMDRLDLQCVFSKDGEVLEV